MFPTDDPFAVKRAIVAAQDLVQMLKGYGSPRITPRGVVDGQRLADTLAALQAVIDSFLKEQL